MNYSTNIFAVIVTFNASKWIEKCLTSILKSSIQIKIIIIDNNSSDNSIEILNSYNLEKLFILNKNIGFGQANNIGIKYAIKNDADFVILINQDVYLSENTIELLLKSSRNDVLQSALHLNFNQSRLDYNFKKNLFDLSNNNGELFEDSILNRERKQLYYCDFVNAAFWFIPRNIIEKVGGFNPLFFHYGEDVNYCYRIRFHDYKVAINPNTSIIHDRECFGNNKMFNKNYYLRQMLLLYTNIFYSNYSILKKSFVLNSKYILKLIYSLLVFDYKTFFNILYSYIILTFLIKQIIHSRKLEKKGQSWL